MISRIIVKKGFLITNSESHINYIEKFQNLLYNKQAV